MIWNAIVARPLLARSLPVFRHAVKPPATSIVVKRAAASTGPTKPWSDKEYERLVRAVSKVTAGSGANNNDDDITVDWRKVARLVGTRDEYACKASFYELTREYSKQNAAKQSDSSNKEEHDDEQVGNKGVGSNTPRFTEEEDLLLRMVVEHYDKLDTPRHVRKWEIIEAFFPNRTDTGLQKRYSRYISGTQRPRGFKTYVEENKKLLVALENLVEQAAVAASNGEHSATRAATTGSAGKLQKTTQRTSKAVDGYDDPEDTKAVHGREFTPDEDYALTKLVRSLHPEAASTKPSRKGSSSAASKIDWDGISTEFGRNPEALEARWTELHMNGKLPISPPSAAASSSSSKSIPAVRARNSKEWVDGLGSKEKEYLVEIIRSVSVLTSTGLANIDDIVHKFK